MTKSAAAPPATGRKSSTASVGIAGLGLIGGSLGLALRRAPGWRVTGYDPHEEIRSAAAGLGACDKVAGSIEDLAADSDVVVIAAPSSLIPEAALEAARCMRRGAVLTDVGSVKMPIQAQIIPSLPRGVEYIGGHPMAGSEKSGLEAASADLFEGAVWALTTAGASRKAIGIVEALVSATGALPIIVDAQEHDQAVAFSSHLPYMAAMALALSSEEKARDLPLVTNLVARGFRDSTRLARSNPSVAMDYCILNNRALVEAIEVFERRLHEMKAALEHGDYRSLMASAQQASDYLRRHS